VTDTGLDLGCPHRSGWPPAVGIRQEPKTTAPSSSFIAGTQTDQGPDKATQERPQYSATTPYEWHRCHKTSASSVDGNFRGALASAQ